MPAARAAAGLVPTETKRRPTTVVRISSASSTIATTAMITVCGNPGRLREREAREARRRGRRRGAARDLQDDAGEQRVHAERRDERRDAQAGDRETREEARRDAREHDQPDRLGQPAFHAVRNLRDDDRRQRDHPRHREVEPALLDHERLADRRDREDRGERQHREQRAVAVAARREQRADGEEQGGREPDRREARHAEPAAAQPRLGVAARSTFGRDCEAGRLERPIGRPSRHRRQASLRERSPRVRRA